MLGCPSPARTGQNWVMPLPVLRKERMNWKGIAFLLTAASLAGCASARLATLPGGGQGYLVTCSGIQLTLADCYGKAAEACTRGYAVATEDLTSTVLNPFQRSMLISCRS